MADIDNQFKKRTLIPVVTNQLIEKDRAYGCS